MVSEAVGPGCAVPGMGDRAAGKHLPARTVFGCVPMPRFFLPCGSSSPHQTQSIGKQRRDLLFQAGKGMGTQISHVGLHWAGGDQGTRSCSSPSPCCSPAPQARKGQCSFTSCQGHPSLERAGGISQGKVSPRRCLLPPQKRFSTGRPCRQASTCTRSAPRQHRHG